jgi:hypothetical protein
MQSQRVQKPAKHWPSGCRLLEIPHPNQIVGCQSQGEHPVDTIYSAVPGLAQAGDRFQPPEDLLDAFALPLADFISTMSRRSFVDGAAAARVVRLCGQSGSCVGVRVLRAVLTALTMLTVLASLAFAQLPEDRFEVAVKFDRGRFVANRDTARISLSAHYRSVLRADMNDAKLLAEFCDALDREFRLMPKPYFFTLSDAQKTLDRAGKLIDPEIEKRRQWNGALRQFPGVGIMADDRGNPGGFDEHLERILQRSGLAEWDNRTDDFDRPLRFRLRDALIVNELDTPQLGTILARERLLTMLKPLDRLPANPELVRAILLDYYTPRGITPKIDLKLDTVPRTLSIFETSRIARILLPAELRDFSLAQRIAYEALPERVFRAFRRKGRERMNVPLDEEATKREIDLSELVSDAENNPPGSTPFQLPPVDTSALAEIQQQLLPLHHTASLFDFKPNEALFDLVIDPTTAQQGAGSEANPVLGTAETPPNAPETTARPGAAADVQPSPVAAAATPNPKRSGNPPRQQQHNFLGGGFEYRPGQGIRALGSYQRSDTLGVDVFGIELGGAGGGFSTAHYSRDYLFFDTLGRRLSLDLVGGSDFEQQRILDNVPTDERRTGGALRFDLEGFRDLAGQHLSFFLEARHETVRLTAAEPEKTPRVETVTQLNTIDAGLAYSWRRTLTRHPANVRIESALRFGIGLSETEPAFRRLRIAAHYHQSIAGPVEVESRLQSRTATEKTPVFELPSLGGEDSVRGFRTDESLGGRLWAWQSELWFPVLGSGAPSKFRDFVRRNVRLAALYDLGGAYRLAPRLSAMLEGIRQGAGLGLRVRYQGVVIEADWAYGFGSNDSSRPGRGRFYFSFRLP